MPLFPFQKCSPFSKFLCSVFKNRALAEATVLLFPIWPFFRPLKILSEKHYIFAKSCSRRGHSFTFGFQATTFFVGKKNVFFLLFFKNHALVEARTLFLRFCGSRGSRFSFLFRLRAPRNRPKAQARRKGLPRAPKTTPQNTGNTLPGSPNAPRDVEKSTPAAQTDRKTSHETAPGLPQTGIHEEWRTRTHTDANASTSRSQAPTKHQEDCTTTSSCPLAGVIAAFAQLFTWIILCTRSLPGGR